MTHPERYIKLVISYDGSEFSGWQRQDNARTIQQEIEQALTTMSCEPITLHGAGRTDAGVHAEAMVAHFSTRARVTEEAFQRGLNSMLPLSIRILSATKTDDTFHARFSATGKEYHYHVFTGPIQPPLERNQVYHCNYKIDRQLISQCLQTICGTHDFSSFENSGTRDKSRLSGRGAIRTIYTASLVTLDTHYMTLQFTGDGFLRNMVRNMVGTILEVGRGKFSVDDFADMLRARDRSAAGPTAPAHGLRLKRVYYDSSFKTGRDSE